MVKKTKSALSLFKKVKLLVLDVDGVLTKGEIIYDRDGGELKIFNVKDGLGVFLLGLMGINVILATARDSGALRRRAKDMKVDVYAGILPKTRLLPVITKKYGVKDDSICFVGDDFIDIDIMRRIGIPVAVKNAPLEVKNIALYITKQKGGEGAVREVIELILKSKGLWAKALEKLSEFKTKKP